MYPELPPLPPQIAQVATTSRSNPRPYLPAEVYFNPEHVDLTYRAGEAQIYFFKLKTSRAENYASWMASVSQVLRYSFNKTQLQIGESNRQLAERLCEQHPDISTDPGIFGGNPHINNVRLTVANILGKIYNYGSTKAVADIYAPYVTESQVKEAIAYAQDFLEEAIHAGEPSEVDG